MEHKQHFLRRLYIYQQERFPVVAHGVMIAAFTFSAVSYSRIGRGASGFISLADFIIGVGMSFSLFFLLRICDEFKDQEDDAQFRSYLPVPRGLISLKELGILGAAIVVLQFIVLAIFQTSMLPLYFVVLLYMGLMASEFFVADWLKERQVAYIVSHMFIIPLIDLYSSGLDWRLEGTSVQLGVIWFMIVSFMNGLVLEIGRKIRSEDGEEEGVVSYTKLYGRKKAAYIWICLMAITLAAVIGAGIYAQFSTIGLLFLSVLFLLCITPAIRFTYTQNDKHAKQIEHISGIWTVLMYLSLGAIPMAKNLIA